MNTPPQQEAVLQQEAALAIDTLPVLNLDHPGAKDPEYRKRRDKIAEAAIAFHRSDPATRTIPTIHYTGEEQEVWRYVNERLAPLHKKWACSLYKEGRQKIIIPSDHVPQIADLSADLEHISGFRLEPVHGLVEPRVFLSRLEDGVMLSTQYMRHPSQPEFTPEPDIIHEVLGHVPMFTHPELNAFQRMIGKAARIATDKELEQISRLYWFTVEYGLIRENGEVKAFGAGLLGGIQDLTRAMTGKVFIQPFDMKKITSTDYDYSRVQQELFFITSLEVLRRETRALITSFRAYEAYDDFGAPLDRRLIVSPN